MATVALATIDFHGDKLQAVEQDGKVLVAIRPLCDALGITVQRQLAKLKAAPWAVVTETVTTGADGKNYAMACLDVDSIPMWLAGIVPSKVCERARPKLLLFQLEAHRVLRDHFVAHRGARPSALPLDIAQGIRLRDNPSLRRDAGELCAMTARASGHSLQRIYGYVRARYRVGSPFDVAALAWNDLRQLLQDVALGRLLLPRRAPRRLVADTRQAALPFSKPN